MNRLLRIGFDTLVTSVTPILGWFLLGILVDKNLINIFSLIYPMQFIITSIQSVFGTGANISAIKDKNKNSIFSGVVLGAGTGLIILGSIAINIDKYILFMNMDTDTYKIFGVYAVIQMFFQLLLKISLCKLYFEKERTKHSFIITSDEFYKDDKKAFIYPFDNDDYFSSMEYVVPLQVLTKVVSQHNGIDCNIPSDPEFHKKMGSYQF